MKFTTDIQALSAAAASAPADGRAMTALGFWRMEAAGDALTVSSTDTQVARADTLACKVSAPGVAACDPKLLRAGLAGLTGEAEISLSDGRVKVRHARGSMRLPTIDVNLMPVIDARGEVLAEAGGADLMEAMARVSYCVNQKEARMWLRGVSVTDSYVAASDGHRMSIVNIDTPSLPAMIVPDAAVAALRATGGDTLRVIGSGEGPVACEVEGAATRVRTVLIDSGLPNFHTALSASRQDSGYVQFNIKAAMAAVARLLPFTDRAKNFPVEMTAGAGGISLSTRDSACDERVDGALTDSEGMSLVLSGQYLLDLLRLGDTDVVWWFAPEDAAQIFTFPERSREMHVIMPVMR